ncbi:MAG: 30S ribosomal protein S3 [Candidatus Abyssobacteria bacterium SURF_17]|uniref:Small ribosomal subunit protein uS3 n=1 Tax=Candidatus Abyssobacteria bacterium SURF_17 TaxID=2093361 RepID=A0A419EVI6_9BACT|nr:MAG: 30S ribosomal protein S3 [Candidatus Abyssubacteria bacterium SURF_17]
MGQKVHPTAFRLGTTKTWSSRWFAKKDYAKLLHEDLKVVKLVKQRLAHAGISKVEVERMGQKARVTIHTARPGIVIGRRGSEVDQLRAELEKLSENEVYIVVQEIKNPELDAQLVAENIALQLERQVSFRRAIKRAVTTSMRLGAKGIKVQCAGRLAGAEIARTEWYREGRVPLQTLRADIDYGFAESNTTFGKIGVKVWIFHHDEIHGREPGRRETV